MELRLRLLRELAHRLRWSGVSYGLFAFLFTLNLQHGIRGVAFVLSGTLTALGIWRTLLARSVIAGARIHRDGDRLIQLVSLQSLLFGAFVTLAMWVVNGQVIPEFLLVVGVAGVSSVSASLLAPFPRVAQFNVCAQVLTVYIWSLYALPRYGWLLVAFILFHAVAMAQLIRMNSAHIREMFLAQAALEAQSWDLRQARDAAEKASSAKMRFLANMSHEIRTPLNGIMGLAQVLNDLSLTREQREVLDDIGHSGNHLLAIVNDVLDMAKVSSGKLTLEDVPFDLPRLIREVAAPAAALAEGRRLRFALRMPAELPKQVTGDSVRIRQVVANLLSNAVKFTTEGEVRLTVEAPAADWLHFQVSDTGIGLSPRQQASLFQEFHQVDSSTTRKFGGSGLGLAISRSLAELMGGRLWAESTLGQGSTFHFELPVGLLQRIPAGAPAVAFPLPSLPADFRVLVVEDNVINQKVIGKMVSQAGALVEIAENGRVAVERHCAAPFDLVLMDCQMPELDGYEATSEIRSLPGDAALVPIIGVTANAFAEDRERCIRAGMNDYIAKPVSRHLLLSAIAQFAYAARAQRRPWECPPELDPSR